MSRRGTPSVGQPGLMIRIWDQLFYISTIPGGDDDLIDKAISSLSIVSPKGHVWNTLVHCGL